MRKFALACLAAFWMSTAVGADKPQLGPVPEWVKPYAWRGDTGPTTEAAVKVLLADQQVDFTAAGVETYVESVVKIQTPQGLSAMGTLTVVWNPATDTVIVHKVHIVRGEQTIDAIAVEEPFTIVRRENNLEYASLDGVLTAVIQPPGLQVGDIIDMAVTVRRSNPVFAGASEHAALLPGDAAVAIGRIRARWPASLPMRWKATDALPKVDVRNRGGMNELSVEMRDLQPLVQPTGAPFRFAVERRIDFTTLRAWSDVAERLAPLYETAATLTPDSSLHAEIARIKAETVDPAVRAAAALRLVQDQVRYVFLGMNEGGLVPATADLTWTRRFGDCKAKSSLLMALLRDLGIPAEPIAVNTAFGDVVQGHLPMVGAFDHVIVRATIDGKAYWLDGARTGDRNLNHLVAPGYFVGLPLVSRDASLVTIMPGPLTEPLVETSIRIDATDGITLPAPFHVESVLRGDAATKLRLQFAAMPPSELDRAQREFWKAEYSFVDIETVATRFEEGAGRAVLSMTGRARMDWGGDTYTTDGFTVGYNANFERPAGSNHDAPYVVPFPTFAKVSETILLPYRGRRFSVEGDDIDQTVAGVEYRRKASIESGVFTAVATVRSVAPEFPASEAATAQLALREMAKKGLYLRAPAGYMPTDKEMAADLAKEPATAAAYVTRGNNRLDRHDYTGAIDDFDKALALKPDNATALADRGIAYLWMRNHDLGRRDLDAAFALEPRNAIVFRGRGMLAAQQGDALQSIEHYSRSLDLEPGNGFALEQRAGAYAASQQYDKALADLDALITADPDYLRPYLLRAKVFMLQGKHDEAAREADAVVAADPGNAAAHATAGFILSSIGRRSEAMEELDRAIELAPNEQIYLARASLRSPSDLAGRQSDVDAALKLNPTSLDGLMLRASLQSDGGRHAEAARTYTAALDLDGTSVGLLTARGIAYSKSGKAALASKDLQGARELAKLPIEQNNMCYALAAAAVELSMALELCEAAVHGEPKSAAIHDSFGFVLLRLDRYQDAIGAFDAALLLAPDLSMSQYGRGIAKRRAGDHAGGDVDLQAAVAKDANVAEAYERFGVTP